MEELRRLYEERNMKDLVIACHRKIDAGKDAAMAYAYMAYAQAAMNSFAKVTLEEAAAAYAKAAELCADNEAELREASEGFIKELKNAAAKANEKFEEVALTEDVIKKFRTIMRLCADALVPAALHAPEEVALEAKKTAADCMVKLCAPYKYEANMGKAVVSSTDHAPDKILAAYGEKYDALVEEIKAADPSYVPAEIQKAGAAPVKEKKAPELNPDGTPKKKSLIDRLLDFF